MRLHVFIARPGPVWASLLPCAMTQVGVSWPAAAAAAPRVAWLCLRQGFESGSGSNGPTHLLCYLVFRDVVSNGPVYYLRGFTSLQMLQPKLRLLNVTTWFRFTHLCMNRFNEIIVYDYYSLRPNGSVVRSSVF